MNTRTLASMALATALAACGPVAVDTYTVIPDTGPCIDGWVDPGSGLCWQPEARPEPLVWSAAREYCVELRLGGHADWRLPTIDEMRSLIRECPASEAGGTCRVSDGSGRRDWDMGECMGCAYLAGPGEDGAYWDPAVEGPTSRGYWSASEVSNRLSESWIVTSHDAFVAWEAQAARDHHVRCVRDRPRF